VRRGKSRGNVHKKGEPRPARFFGKDVAMNPDRLSKPDKTARTGQSEKTLTGRKRERGPGKGKTRKKEGGSGRGGGISPGQFFFVLAVTLPAAARFRNVDSAAESEKEKREKRHPKR